MKYHDLLSLLRAEKRPTDSFLTTCPNLEQSAAHWRRIWPSEIWTHFFDHFKDMKQIRENPLRKLKSLVLDLPIEERNLP